MKLKIKTDYIPVLDWCDISLSTYLVEIMESVQKGNYIICSSDKDIVHGDPCAFIFYDDYSKRKISKVFIGMTYVVGFHADLDAPIAYQFMPMKEIEIICVGYDIDDGFPDVLIQKYKKL